MENWNGNIQIWNLSKNSRFCFFTITYKYRHCSLCKNKIRFHFYNRFWNLSLRSSFLLFLILKSLNVIIIQKWDYCVLIIFKRCLTLSGSFRWGIDLILSNQFFPYLIIRCCWIVYKWLYNYIFFLLSGNWSYIAIRTN